MGNTWKSKNIIKNGQYFKSYVFFGKMGANISDFFDCPRVWNKDVCLAL